MLRQEARAVAAHMREPELCVGDLPRRGGPHRRNGAVDVPATLIQSRRPGASSNGSGNATLSWQDFLPHLRPLNHAADTKHALTVSHSRLQRVTTIGTTKI